MSNRQAHTLTKQAVLLTACGQAEVRALGKTIAAASEQLCDKAGHDVTLAILPGQKSVSSAYAPGLRCSVCSHHQVTSAAAAVAVWNSR